VKTPLSAGQETDSNGFKLVAFHVNNATLHARGGKCQSGGVKKVQRIQATIVKSIIPIPINIPETNKVKIMVSIISFVLL
jgi:hypothetical protein